MAETDWSIYQLLGRGVSPDSAISGLERGTQFALNRQAAQQRSAIGRLALEEAQRQRQVEEQTRAVYRQYYGQDGPPAPSTVGQLAPGPVQEVARGGQPTAAFPHATTTPGQYSSPLREMLAQYQAEGADVSTSPPPLTSPQTLQRTPGQPPVARGMLAGAQAGVDTAGLVRDLYQIDPKAGREAEKAARDSHVAQLEMVGKQNSMVSQVARAILLQDTQQAYEAGVNYLRQAGIPVDHLPAYYDRRMVEGYYEWATDAETRVKQAQQELYRQQAAAFGAKARRDERETQAAHDIAAEDAGAQPAAGAPTPQTMSEADIREAMRQTGRPRQEVIDAARAKGYRVPGDPPPPAPAAAPPPATAPAAPAPGGAAAAPPQEPAAAPLAAPTPTPGGRMSDAQRLQRLEQLRDEQEATVERVRRRWGSTDAGKDRIAQAETELARRNQEIHQLRTRITQQQEKAMERRTPSAELRDELLGMGVAPEAATPQQVRQAQTAIQQRKERLGPERELDKPLSTQDAALYGVPPGTTHRELREMARGGPQVAGTLPPLSGEAAKTYQMGSRMNRGHEAVAALEAAGVVGSPFLNTLEQTVDKLTGAVGTVVGVASGGGWPGAGAGAGIGFGVGNLATPLVNQLRTPEQRRYVSAQLAFIAGILRKESGAAITKEEYQQYGRMFFPQSGDDVDTIAAKSAMRQAEIASLQEQFPNRPFPGAPAATTKGGATPEIQQVPPWARPAPRGELYP